MTSDHIMKLALLLVEAGLIVAFLAAGMLFLFSVTDGKKESGDGKSR